MPFGADFIFSPQGHTAFKLRDAFFGHAFRLHLCSASSNERFIPLTEIQIVMIRPDFGKRRRIVDGLRPFSANSAHPTARTGGLRRWSRIAGRAAISSVRLSPNRARSGLCWIGRNRLACVGPPMPSVRGTTLDAPLRSLSEERGPPSMGRFTVTHEIGCDRETFWKVFLDNAFSNALYLEALSSPEFRVMENHETDRQVSFKWLLSPKQDFPGPLAKLMGPGFRYTVDGQFDKTTQTCRLRFLPSSMADKIRIERTIRAEPIGDNKARRIADIEIEAKIFGVGGLFESTMEKQSREENDKSASFMNQWIASRDKTS